MITWEGGAHRPVLKTIDGHSNPYMAYKPWYQLIQGKWRVGSGRRLVWRPSQHQTIFFLSQSIRRWYIREFVWPVSVQRAEKACRPQCLAGWRKSGCACWFQICAFRTSAEYHAKCSFWLSSTPPSNKVGAKVWKRSMHNCSNYWHHFLGQTSLLHFCTSSCLRFLAAWVKSGKLGDSLDCNCGELWGMQ